MTLNKYQKYNESIRLDDEAKEDILNRVMEADIKPVRRASSGWRWTAVFACGLAAIAFLILPRVKPSDYEQSAMAAEESPAENYDMAAEESAEAPMEAEAAAGSLSGSESLSMDLGYPIPNMEGYAAGADAEYLADSSTQGRILLSTETNTITILTNRAEDSEVKEESVDTAEAEVSAENNADSETVTNWLFEADGVSYELFFANPVTAEEAQKLEAYIREDIGG